ncbi:MAG: hypothetical protein C0167_03655 [Nitrososphaera sp.]|nr:MAG: hypothetical protein C0167_03655 [Nitrososphaera sp.]
MVYCAGAFVNKPLETLFTPLPVIKQYIACTVNAVFQYNVTTQCFPCGAGGLKTPCGPKFNQVPPWWWIPTKLWFNNYTAPLWLALAKPFNVTHPFDVACIPKSRIR